MTNKIINSGRPAVEQERHYSVYTLAAGRTLGIRNLAQSATRRAALKKFGVDLAGMALACRLVLELTEIGPGNTDTYTLKGTLTSGSGN